MKDIQLARDNIMALEETMKNMAGCELGNEQKIAQITHYHAPGLYGREMRMPAGSLVVGKIHKTEHICVLSMGRVTVANGLDVVTYEAPTTIISPVGAKRAIYAHEDSVWTNFHAVELDDPEEIEEEVIAKSFEELDAFLEYQDRKRIL